MRRRGSVRQVLAGGALTAAALVAGPGWTGPALAVDLVGGDPAVAGAEPVRSVPTQGLPLDRLPEMLLPGPTGEANGPGRSGVPTSLGWLVAGGGVLVLLAVRQRSLAAAAGNDVATRPGIATGTPALTASLSAALTDSWDSGEPVGLVLLRVELVAGPLASARAAGATQARAGSSDAGRPGLGRAAGSPSPANTVRHEVTEGEAVLAALDAAVPLVAGGLQSRARAGDPVVRLGVNRLAAVLPGTGEAELPVVAERLRAAVSGGVGTGIRVRVGWASTPADGAAPAVLLRAAEGRLSGTRALPAI